MSSHDEDIKLVYLSDYPELPTDAPIGHPHIVNLSALQDDVPTDDITIADVVASVLFKYRPSALTAFLDLDRSHVHFLCRSGGELDFCISRKGQTVKITSSTLDVSSGVAVLTSQVGWLNEREQGGWDLVFKYVIDEEATGNWSPMRCIGGENGPETHVIKDAEEIREGVQDFAYAVGAKGAWEQDMDSEIEFITGLWQGMTREL